MQNNNKTDRWRSNPRDAVIFCMICAILTAYISGVTGGSRFTIAVVTSTALSQVQFCETERCSVEERQRVHLDVELISQCVCLILYEHAHTSVFMYMSGHK